MRTVVPNDADHPQNRGIVVFHAGANVARRWNDFRDFSHADQEYFDELLPLEGLEFKDASRETILRVILARAGEPRKLGRGMETAETAAERAQIDRAIAGVLFHAGLRRSEAAELRWGDVEPAASIPGALTIRVRTSKTNRDGEATDVRLAKNGAAAALTALRPANASPTALVFRGLNGQSIGRRFAAAANAAGVEGVTAHSGRVGLASELTAAGASTTETMLAGGWKTARMVAHYSAGASAERGAVAKYL